MSNAMTRREMLKATGAAAATVPLFRSPRAQAAYPKRLLSMMSFNGTVLDQWVPTGGEKDFVLGPVLAPLNELRNDIIVASGVASHVAQFDKNHRGCGPHCAYLNLSTGVNTIATASRAQDGGGQSFDQLVADKIGTGTKFPSLAIGTQGGETADFSYRSAGRSTYHNPDFYVNFNRVFGDLEKVPGQLDRMRAMRQSVLDRSAAEITALVQRKLGRDAALKLGAHQEAVRDMEKSVTAPQSATCTTAPAMTAKLDAKNSANTPTLMTATMDLVTTALACDLTRVLALSIFTIGDQTVRPTWLGINDRDGHAVAHESYNGEAGRQRKVALERYKTEVFAYLLKSMKAKKEDGRTLLDNTVVIYANGMSRGTHVTNPIPVVLAGGAGAWRCGRWLQFGKMDGKYDPAAGSYNDLVVSVCNAAGVPLTTWGDPQWSKGPLPGLV